MAAPGRTFRDLILTFRVQVYVILEEVLCNTLSVSVGHRNDVAADLNSERQDQVSKGPSWCSQEPPDFMTLLNHAVPRTEEQRPTIVDTLTRTYTHLPLCHGHTLFIVTDTHQHIGRGLYTYMTSYLAQAYRLSIPIDKTTLFINSLLIRL